MNALLLGPIRKANPGTLQSDQGVIAQFVARRHELDRTLEVVEGNIDSPSCQHVLVIGAHGQGKSMLLTRVAAELRTNERLSKCLLPVRFTEENHEISEVADFWLEALFHLARECSSRDPDLAQELQGSHAELTLHWRDRFTGDIARNVVLKAAGRLGTQLVLMVENVQTLFNKANEDFGWKLRNVLQTEPQIILIATATGQFDELHDASQPFFEFFRFINLRPLPADECCCLWRTVTGDAISDDEIRPLQILTGGNPRLLAIAAGLSRDRLSFQPLEELAGLVDEHTEYFRSQLEALGKTERRVFVAMLDLWQPARPIEIAARARMDIRAVSTMLGRLVSRGIVIVEGSGKRRRYSAAERLFSIYYRLRREQDAASDVRNLIHFMAAFYVTPQTIGMSTRTPASIDALRSLYSAYVPGSEQMVREVVGAAVNLAASGNSEHEILEILLSDEAKSQALEPLVVALRRRANIDVRTSAEVLEVAADIEKRIEARPPVAGSLERRSSA